MKRIALSVAVAALSCTASPATETGATEVGTSGPGSSEPGTPTSEATGSESSTGSPTSSMGAAETSDSSTGASRPSEYSALGAPSLGFKHRWIQVQKYSPSLELCLTVSVILDPNQPPPGFEDVDLWGTWRAEGAWVRAPVVDCQDRNVERTFATGVSGRIEPEADEVAPCLLPFVELSIDLPESDLWLAEDIILAEDLVVEEAYWCD